ncbi:hypothetical protein [Dactylosporangium sp. NPDC051484]|uniref:DUF6907 domain-containing protein n=1 Tax=Dactylosporangium sp. NPDC051484 TaxID=3154942 RepID=UPI003450DAC7
MTILVRSSSFRPVASVEPAPCPPWCIGTDCRSTDPDATRYHMGQDASVQLYEPDVTVCVTVCRDDDEAPAAGEPYVWISGDGPDRPMHDWAAMLPPAAAVELGQALIAAGLKAAGLARTAVAS